MRFKKIIPLLVSAILLVLNAGASAGSDPRLDVDAYNKCLLDKIRAADDETSAREIREACLIEAQRRIADPTMTADATEEGSDEATPLEKRIEETRATENLKFVITPFKPNYVMVGYNPDPNTAPFREAFPDEDVEFDPAEVKFQISFMFPIVRDIFGSNGDLYFAYTNRSFWQVFNEDLSAPFRETNHEPEFWIRFDSNRKILGFTNKMNTFGYNHQSNGRNRPISRSWNRLFANFVFERNNFAFTIKPPVDQPSVHHQTLRLFVG